MRFTCESLKISYGKITICCTNLFFETIFYYWNTFTSNNKQWHYTYFNNEMKMRPATTFQDHTIRRNRKKERHFLNRLLQVSRKYN